MEMFLPLYKSLLPLSSGNGYGYGLHYVGPELATGMVTG